MLVGDENKILQNLHMLIFTWIWEIVLIGNFEVECTLCVGLKFRIWSSHCHARFVGYSPLRFSVVQRFVRNLQQPSAEHLKGKPHPRSSNSVDFPGAKNTWKSFNKGNFNWPFWIAIEI